ncbi:hypothetical protein AUF62_00020 [archaeon 13_1_20CM_52_20]|nr:MAG: hypothetical protein AUF62_00020 [archaeon 13_1_20CM_52_20]
MLKLSTGALITALGWMVSSTAVVGAVAFAMVWQSVFDFGGAYPPELVYFLLWPLLAFGAIITYSGARTLHRPILLLFSLSSVAIMLITLQYMPCFPIERCLVVP